MQDPITGDNVLFISSLLPNGGIEDVSCIVIFVQTPKHYVLSYTVLSSDRLVAITMCY